MGFLVIEAANPKLSFVLKKNPQTSPHIKPIRKGFCMGWFNDDKNVDPQRYVVRFFDVGENVSFPNNDNEKYDYLAYMQYCAPILMTSIVKEMFGTVLNQGVEEDVIARCSVEQASIKLSGRAVKIIEKLNSYIKKYNIKITKTNVERMFNIVVSSEGSTISDLFRYVYLIGHVLQCLTVGYGEKPVDGALDKIVKIINDINAPYYVRYTIKIHMIGKQEFIRVKNALEGSSQMTLVQGNTQSQRFDFISKHVMDFCIECSSKAKAVHIVDIGCGEGYYIKNLLSMLNSKRVSSTQSRFSITYHAHDIESSEMDKIDTLIKNDDDYVGVVPYRSLDSLIESVNNLTTDNKDESVTHEHAPEVIVVFSEVIEHIPCNKVNSFVTDLINRLSFRKMIITTPQSEFNVHYLLPEGEFRHPDHKQEFTKTQFVDLVESIVQESDKRSSLISEYAMIGDIVDGVSMSQAVILSQHDVCQN